MLASPYYGASGKVIEIDVKQSRIRVQLHVPVEPDLSFIIDQHQACFLSFQTSFLFLFFGLILLTV